MNKNSTFASSFISRRGRKGANYDKHTQGAQGYAKDELIIFLKKFYIIQVKR